MVAYQRQAVDRLVGENSADNRADTSAVVANRDGSVVERLEATHGTVTTFTKADVTAATAWTTANSPVTIFTVTGTVLMQVWGEVTTGITSTSSTGTLALGTTDNASVFIGATTANGTNFATGDVWTTTTTAKSGALPGTGNWFVVRSDNVTVTIATNNMTAGAVNIYCRWIPITAGATVV